jgi:Tfp pilus assembly protein PilX
MTMQTNYRKQSGAALIVGLLLLVVITVLAVSGMRHEYGYHRARNGA